LLLSGDSLRLVMSESGGIDAGGRSDERDVVLFCRR
jgi:hypothetical protein